MSVDAVQAAHVGPATTPHLEALASESYGFSRAYSVASWTVPASMSWFTGVYPSEHRMTNKFAVFDPPRTKVANVKELAPGLVTLAEVLRRHGYVTAGFTGNAGVSGQFGFDRGFDVYDEPAGKFGGFDRSVPRALEWLGANREKKFFLFLHGYDAHGQSPPPPVTDATYDGKFTGAVQEQEALREEGLERGRLDLRPEDVRFWRAVYDAKIRRADARLAPLLRALDPIRDRTLLVVTSDHGTEVLERGRLDHGFTLYEELLRVPLLVRLPGQRAGRRIDDRASSVDLLPTILDVLGLEAPRQARGRSLVPALRGEAVRRDVFAETDYRAYTYKRAVVTPEGWKLIATLEDGRRELYDLEADPAERHDLAAREPDRVRALAVKLFGHWKNLGHDLEAQRWETGLNPVYESQATSKKR